ncbi:unnamed protein product [Ectocarpus sp. 12 AP-2014]
MEGLPVVKWSGKSNLPVCVWGGYSPPVHSKMSLGFSCLISRLLRSGRGVSKRKGRRYRTQMMALTHDKHSRGCECCLGLIETVGRRNHGSVMASRQVLSRGGQDGTPRIYFAERVLISAHAHPYSLKETVNSCVSGARPLLETRHCCDVARSSVGWGWGCTHVNAFRRR